MFSLVASTESYMNATELNLQVATEHCSKKDCALACRWVSLIGALMSVLYSSIAFAASVVAWRQNRGSVAHSIREGSTPDRAFGIMNALGMWCQEC